MGQTEAEAINLLAQPRGRLPEGGLVAQYAEADPGQLVGQRADRLVVVGSLLKFERPTTQTGEFEALGSGRGGGSQHGSGPMGQQHAKVLVAALADSAEVGTRPRNVP